ncbi:hypothetical protein FB446DRAFT_725203 [Lentinula raphanica]|nr:hypothetical protein FB446DRAFT_725203 [Lentinula raphanica]
MLIELYGNAQPYKFYSLKLLPATVTFTTSSTVPGLGYLSGKVIKRFGSAVVNRVDAILIRRRLAQIEDNLGPTSDSIARTTIVKSLYSDLLELSRPVYSLSIRTRAFRVIMSKVGRMDFEDLAQAVIDWPLLESYDLLKAMMECLRTNTSDSQMRERKGLTHLDIFFAAGNDAYKSQLPYALSGDSPQGRFAIAFLLFIAFSVALSSKPSFSELVIETGLLPFIIDFYPNISIPDKQAMKSFPAHLTLHTLRENLDLDQESQEILDTTFQLPNNTVDTLTYIRYIISQPVLLVDLYEGPASSSTVSTESFASCCLM